MSNIVGNELRYTTLGSMEECSVSIYRIFQGRDLMEPYNLLRQLSCKTKYSCYLLAESAPRLHYTTKCTTTYTFKPNAWQFFSENFDCYPVEFTTLFRDIKNFLNGHLIFDTTFYMKLFTDLPGQLPF